MGDPTRPIVNYVRMLMAKLATWLNRVTKGAVLPVHITLASLLGHIPVVWAFWSCRPIVAAAFITGFGLLDALDGALAREQGTQSKLGMLFDAVTDRLKEILVYSGLIIYTAQHVPEVQNWVVVAVAGTSLLVSYVKAKGEMALAGSDSHADTQSLNRTFSSGIARYEIRMTLLVIGLLSGILAPLLHFIIALNLITAALRFLQVAEALKQESAQKPTSTKKRHK